MMNMVIANEIKTRLIELFKTESVTEHYPSHKVRIRVETENIKANFDEYIWISEESIDQFLGELQVLDGERKGIAELHSMSPGEFKLVFAPVDVLGHLSVSLDFKKVDRINDDYFYHIHVKFQIDPTALPRIIKDMRLFIG